MSEAPANPGTGAIQPMNVNEAATAFRGLFGGGDAQPETAPTQEAPQQAQIEEPEGEPIELPEETDGPGAEQPEPEAQPERYTVRINGQDREVSLDELKSGYSMEADYRQKTAKLAEQSRALEAERQTYKQQLDALVPQLQKAAASKWSTVDWQSLAKSDPARYVELQAEYHAEMSRLATANAEHRRLKEADDKARAEQFREFVAGQERLLVEKMPVLKDPEKAKAVKQEISKYLSENGFTEQEIGGVADHRAVNLAWKAMQYDKAVAAKKAAIQKAAPAKPVQRPGVARPARTDADRVAEASNRLKKTGRVDDAAAAFKALKVF